MSDKTNWIKIGEASLSKSGNAIVLRTYGNNPTEDTFAVISVNGLNKVLKGDFKHTSISRGEEA